MPSSGQVEFSRVKFQLHLEIWAKKSLSQKRFGPKTNLVQKIFWAKNNCGPNKIIWTKINFGPKKSGLKKVWTEKKFGPKKSLGHKKVWALYIALLTHTMTIRGPIF